MVVKLDGTVKGRVVELEGDTGLAPGTKACVSIEDATRSVAEIDALIAKTAGRWADRADLANVFEEIEYERTVFLPREVDFDSPS
jgi:hypothetical protein